MKNVEITVKMGIIKSNKKYLKKKNFKQWRHFKEVHHDKKQIRNFAQLRVRHPIRLTELSTVTAVCLR